MASREDKQIMLQVQGDIQSLNKKVDDMTHLWGEFITTTTDLKTIIAKHDRILLGDEVTPSLVKEVRKIQRFHSEFEKADVLGIAKKTAVIFQRKDALLWFLGFLSAWNSFKGVLPAVENFVKSVQAGL